MENKNIFLLIVLMLVVLVTNQKSFSQFRPDTTINNKIFLLDGISIEEEFGDIMSQLNENEDLPDIYFLNMDGKQYLRLIFFPGSSNNEFATFEVGYATSKLKNKNKVRLSNFKTESGLRLGLNKSIFLSIMKNRVRKLKDGTYISRITNTNSSFLKRYNMPIYEAKYYFRNNILVKFYFGFEYP